MKRIARTLSLELASLGIYTIALGALFSVLGLAYAELGVFPIRSSVASSLFLGGGLTIVIYGAAGGGSKGRLADTAYLGALRVVRQPMPFTPILAGLAVIGIGVLTLYV